MAITLFSANEIPVVGEPEDDYSDHAQAFAYGVQRLASEINAEAALENAATTTTSVTSQSLTVGSKTFAVATGLGWAAGIAGRAANTASATNYANFTCTSYSGSSLVVNFDTIVGSGAGITTWTITKSSSASNTATLTSNTFTGTQNWAEGASVASSTTVNLTALTDGNTRALTGVATINAWTIANGAKHDLVYTGAGLTLTYSATTNRLNSAGANVTLATNDKLRVFSQGGVVNVIVTKDTGVPVVAPPQIKTTTRQTVLFGAVDTAGLPSFGGSTGSTTVTQSTTLTVTAANGFDANGNVDRVGQITNASWTGLSTNGTMYLYLDIASNGTCTTGTGTLVPTYREGGADVVTANQFTFNIQEMIGKVGNGATAAQTYRVYVGEVTVAGGVVTAIRWYALRGRYRSAYTATLPNTATVVTQNSNLGVEPEFVQVILRCTTTDNGFAVGNTIRFTTGGGYNGTYIATGVGGDASTVWLSCGGASGFVSVPKGGGTSVALTPANWSYALESKRIWGGAA